VKIKKEGHERCKIGDIEAIDLIDHLERYRFASNYVKGKNVLDIACGTGYGSAILKESGATSVTGVDVSDDAINHAKKEYSGGNISFNLGSITDFDSGVKYDRIVSFETIEHVNDYKAAVANIRNLLKDDGILILSTPNRPVTSPRCLTLSDRPSKYHVREFDVKEIYDELKGAGFRDIEKYGQKQRITIRNRVALAFYYILAAKLKIINGHFSPKVLPIRAGLEPRYTVLVCKK